MDMSKRNPWLRWGDTHVFEVPIAAASSDAILLAGPQLIEAEWSVPTPFILSGYATYIGGASTGDIVVPGCQMTIGVGSSIVQPYFYDPGTWVPIPVPEQIIPTSYFTQGAIIAAQTIIGQPIIRIKPNPLADARIIRMSVTLQVAPFATGVAS